MKPQFYFDVEQHIFDPNDPYSYQTNEAWLALRADRITASIAGDLFVNGKHPTGLGADIINKIERRVMQRFTGWIDDEAASYAEKETIRRGIIFEREAAEWYERKTGRKVATCGFVSRGEYLGCSPDRIVLGDDRRLVQFKIPMPQNFLKEVMADGKDHERQCKTELYVCDYLINDLVIYSPELHTGHIREIKRAPEHDRMLLSKMRVAVRHREHATDVIKKLLTV